MNKVEELINYFSTTYGVDKEWPKQFEVSIELYGRVCQFIFERNWYPIEYTDNEIVPVMIALGPNKGIMLKNTELIIKKEEQINGS